MPKIRYETATGKVNLITTGEDELPVQGCQYMRLNAYPQFDHEKENLYVKGGKLVAEMITPQGTKSRPVA